MKCFLINNVIEICGHFGSYLPVWPVHQDMPIVVYLLSPNMAKISLELRD